MKKPTGFEKFSNKKKSGAVKESHRKEKREFKKEIAKTISEKRSEKKGILREEKPVGRSAKGPGTDRQPVSRRSNATKSNSANPVSRKPMAERSTGSEENAGTARTSAAAKPTRDENRIAVSKTSAPLKKEQGWQDNPPGNLMPLNKFIAHAGICARRDAAALVKTGTVMVNGNTITEPGFKVSSGDEIKLNGKKISLSKHFVYILLNKPKDFITTTEDPQGRKTVLDLIKTATTERVYPIGRLDRNTSGVLLFTNDGDLAQALSHPKHEIKKIYEVTLDKPLTKADFESIRNGLTLEDGFIAPDAIGYADPRDKTIIGIEIHSGRNRIVRRIFEHLKYDVRGLDRVMYAGLTKKNVTRGKWRLLLEKEVRILKHFNKKAKGG